MSKARFNRRQFLESTGRTVAATSLGAMLPVAAGAVTGRVLDEPVMRVLARVCRVMFPHDELNDSYYDACVEGLDEKAAADPALAELLRRGVEDLDGAGAENFLDMEEPRQTAALAAMEATPFFAAVRGHVVVALYDNPNAWPHFGYEGPSYPFGGYLERGFDDIDWLPGE